MSPDRNDRSLGPSSRRVSATEPAEIPWLSVVLGFGPMLPILAGAVLAWWLRGDVGKLIATLTALWGCAILLFLSGVRRGVSFRTEGGPTLAQITTMIGLFCLGFAALVAVSFDLSTVSLGLLLVGYLTVAVLDPIAARRGEAPLFFSRLRPLQIPIAMIGLTALLAFWMATCGGSVSRPDRQLRSFFHFCVPRFPLRLPSCFEEVELTRSRGAPSGFHARCALCLIHALSKPPEFRRQTVELVRAGRDPTDLGREFEPSAQAIRNWVARADRDEVVARPRARA